MFGRYSKKKVRKKVIKKDGVYVCVDLDELEKE
jgi:hypothetical protein